MASILWVDSESECIYRVACPCGDLRRDPIDAGWRWIREASAEAYAVLAGALAIDSDSGVANHSSAG